MDRAQIRHVAELAELTLTAEEEERLTNEIGRIVAFVAELDTLDVSGIEPTAHVVPTTANVLRPDEPEPGLSNDDALQGAPKSAGGGFVVPTFVE